MEGTFQRFLPAMYALYVFANENSVFFVFKRYPCIDKTIQHTCTTKSI